MGVRILSNKAWNVIYLFDVFRVVLTFRIGATKVSDIHNMWLWYTTRRLLLACFVRIHGGRILEELLKCSF